jgi:hypothetical protein
MDQDDDVEHLFSWLQTPELRYREFAGAREITDTVVTWQPRLNAPEPVPSSHDVQLSEEYPPDQFPDQVNAPVDIVDREPVIERSVAVERAVMVELPAAERGPTMIAPTPMTSAEPTPPSVSAGPFTLGAAGRGTPSQPRVEERVMQPPLQTPAPRQAAAPTPVSPPQPSPPAPMAPPQPTSAPAARGLLGGAYRENGADGQNTEPAAAAQPNSPEAQQRTFRSLDAVFGRLAGTRERLPDPRERLRHVPGLGPPAGRPR